MKIIACQQGSEQWEAIRRGRPTASRFSDIITAAKAEYSKGAQAYIAELIAECFTTDVSGFTGSRWTDRGTELEPEAREAFAAHTGLSVRQVGFVVRDDELVGCSPDALIYDPVSLDDIAGYECKAPTPKVHVQYVRDGKLPDDYKAQVHGSLYITELPEWHFWSYCPGMKPFHIITRPDEYTAKLSAAIDRFILEYAEARSQLIPKLKLN